MSDTDENDTGEDGKVEEVEHIVVDVEDLKIEEPPTGNIDANNPKSVVYCPICTMPPEFCEYNVPEVFQKCLPWILENCREVLSKAVLAKVTGEEVIETEEDKSKKRAGVAAKKKAVALTTKVIIARIQRQKKKFVTAVAGLETVPDLKIKDACKAFGKKFSSGASISETVTGEKEVTIQGDCSYDLPAFLIKDFKVIPSTIFFLEDGKLRPYE